MAEHFGIEESWADSGRVAVMLRGHKVGPFDKLADAEKSAKKKNRIAKEKGIPVTFRAVPVDVNPWGQPIAKATESESEGK